MAIKPPDLLNRLPSVSELLDKAADSGPGGSLESQRRGRRRAVVSGRIAERPRAPRRRAAVDSRAGRTSRPLCRIAGTPCAGRGHQCDGPILRSAVDCRTAGRSSPGTGVAFGREYRSRIAPRTAIAQDESRVAALPPHRSASGGSGHDRQFGAAHADREVAMSRRLATGDASAKSGDPLGIDLSCRLAPRELSRSSTGRVVPHRLELAPLGQSAQWPQLGPGKCGCRSRPDDHSRRRAGGRTELRNLAWEANRSYRRIVEHPLFSSLATRSACASPRCWQPSSATTARSRGVGHIAAVAMPHDVRRESPQSRRADGCTACPRRWRSRRRQQWKREARCRRALAERRLAVVRRGLAAANGDIASLDNHLQARPGFRSSAESRAIDSSSICEPSFRGRTRLIVDSLLGRLAEPIRQHDHASTPAQESATSSSASPGSVVTA